MQHKKLVLTIGTIALIILVLASIKSCVDKNVKKDNIESTYLPIMQIYLDKTIADYTFCFDDSDWIITSDNDVNTVKTRIKYNGTSETTDVTLKIIYNSASDYTVISVQLGDNTIYEQ